MHTHLTAMKRIAVIRTVFGVAFGITALAFALLGAIYAAGSLNSLYNVPPSAIQPVQGHGYRIPLTGMLPRAGSPAAFLYTTTPDSSDAPTTSNLRIMENGALLGPAHTIHASIFAEGGGRFSHWGDYLIFSTSDNSDPRSNGRVYSIEQSPSASRLFVVPSLVVGLLSAGWLWLAGRSLINVVARWAAVLSDRFASKSASLMASAILTASLIALALLVVHLSGVAPLFGLTTKPLIAKSESGFAYVAYLPRSMLEKWQDRSTFLTEDGVRLGPSNSQHVEVREIGRGHFSVWGDSVYFSASDNSNPQTNGRRYQAHFPAEPPLVLAAAAVIGLGGSISVLAISLRRSRRQACTRLGLNGSFFAFAAFAVFAMVLQPWSFMLRTTGGALDVWRILTAVAVSVGFFGLKASELPTSLRILARFFAVLFGFLCAFRWYPVLTSGAVGLDEWLIAGNRYVGSLAAALGWFRPSLLFYAIASSLWARRTHERLTGFTVPEADEMPVSDMAVFLLLWCALCANAGKLPWLPRKGAPGERTYQLGLYGALGVHLANYFWSAIQKIRLEGPIGAWITQNPTQALVASAKQLGTAPLEATPTLLDWLYRGMAEWLILSNLLTFLSQLAALPFLFLAPALPALLIFYDVWHLGVFLTTGIFFWKWMVVNAGYAFALSKNKLAPNAMTLAAGGVLCLTAPLAFSLFPAGWYDTFHLNRLHTFAVSDKGLVRVPPAFFLHYSFGAPSATFWSPEVAAALHPTGNYGSSKSLAESLRSRECRSVPGLSAGASPLKPNIARLVRALHADVLAHADAGGRPSLMRIYAYPHHIGTNPAAFAEFAALDLRTVTAYIFRLEPVCTAGSSLQSEARQSGPGAELEVDVR